MTPGIKTTKPSSHSWKYSNNKIVANHVCITVCLNSTYYIKIVIVLVENVRIYVYTIVCVLFSDLILMVVLGAIKDAVGHFLLATFILSDLSFNILSLSFYLLKNTHIKLYSAMIEMNTTRDMKLGLFLRAKKL